MAYWKPRLVKKKERIDMENLDEKCLDALAVYCIELIKQKRFCDAKRIGTAIEAVLNTQRPEKGYGATVPQVEIHRGDTCER